jgi:hypothetical protein
LRTLQTLLVILDGQRLSPGYLTPLKPTALEHMLELKKAADTCILNASPYRDPATLLSTPAFIASLKAGQDAIYLADVDGNLNKANGPAYYFSQPV